MNKLESFENLSNEEAAEYIADVSEMFRCTEGLDQGRPVEVVAYAAIHYAFEYALRHGVNLEDAGNLMSEIVSEYSINFDPSIIFNGSDEVH